MILKKYRIPIYGGQLWVCVSNSFTKAIEEIENTTDVKLDDNKEDLRKTSAMAYQFYLPDGHFRVLIVIKPQSKISVVSHEALHVVNWVFHHCGIKHSFTNDEAQCYLLEWVIERVLITKDKR